MNNKIMSFLGLCFRAGKLKTGETAAETSVKKKEAFLVIISEDASANTKKKFTNSAFYYKTQVIVYGSKKEFGKALGKTEISVMAVTDKGFSAKFKELFDAAL